jgi:hypothetical protein
MVYFKIMQVSYIKPYNSGGCQMLASIKKILESIISKGIYDMIKFLFGIILVGITGLATHIAANNIKYLIPYSTTLAIITAAVIGLLGLVIYKRFNPIYNMYLQTDFKYLFLKKELSYEYTDGYHITYKKKIKLKVLYKSLDRYYDKYNWTGSGTPVITCNNKNYKIVWTTKRDSFQQFEVHFNREYKKGDEIDFILTFDLKNIENKADPAISTTIEEPTNYLKLHIKISQDYREGTANAEIFPVTDSRIPIDTTKKDFDNYGEITWEITKPQMLLVYSLNWKAPESKTLNILL